MKILVLNGSPKKDRSDTMHLTRAFLNGMNGALPCDVTIVHAVEKRILPCTGCFTCMRGDGHCVLRDDMDELLPQLLSCDVMICSYPLYYYGMPAPLKALIDRTLPMGKMTMVKVGDRYEHESQADYSHMRFVMISGCGFPNAKHNFEAAKTQFRLAFGADSTILTVPESPLFNIAEARPVTEPYLELVRQAGREYAETGAVGKETMAKLAVPMIPEETYAQMVNQTMQS